MKESVFFPKKLIDRNIGTRLGRGALLYIVLLSRRTGELAGRSIWKH